jgi:hypothetical protein
MFLKKEHFSFYQKYGSQVFEQGPAVLSDDLNSRLKGYLDNDTLLTKLGEILSKYDDGEYELSDLNKESFGIKTEDRLFVKVDKSDKKSPKFMMWIMNDEFLWGDLDMEVAAAILKSGGEGTSFAEKGVIGSIGSFFSGGGEDSGTDEDTIAGLAGAFAKIAAEKSVDPEIYFDKLEEVFKAKYGQNIKDFLETEFSGYGETVSLNTFRRKIEPSVWRGLNPWSILGDVALTIVTFGGSAAFTAGLKGAQVANAAGKASKLAKASGMAKASAALGRGVGAIADITRLSKVFAKLDNARKLAALEKAGVKIGGESFEWIAKSGSKGTAKLISKSDDGTKLMVSYSGRSPIATQYDTLLTQLSPKTATDVLTAANINMTAKGLVAARAVDISSNAGETSQGAEEPGLGAKAAEVMGYYDTLAADPNAFIQNAKQQGASDIASMILDLKNGSGLFGNTTSQEECSIALLITGLTPEMAKEVSAEYKKIDAKMDVYGVIDDELGGDISIFAKAYWTGCTGEGDEYKATIENVYSRIKKGAAKPAA